MLLRHAFKAVRWREKSVWGNVDDDEPLLGDLAMDSGNDAWLVGWVDGLEGWMAGCFPRVGRGWALLLAVD